MMEVDPHMATMIIIGRPLEVDFSHNYEIELMHMRFQFRFLEQIHGLVQLVVNGEGYTIGVHVERGEGVSSWGRGSLRPPPPSDRIQDEDKYDDLIPTKMTDATREEGYGKVKGIKDWA
jgi:hypothetical protein